MMINDSQQLAVLDKSSHLNYLRDFRVEQCQLFLQHKCTQHRPFSCFYWHFHNQRRRRPGLRQDGSFSYDPDFYCNDYDEQSGICPNGDDCLLLHRNANDTEKRFHLRYYKTGLCTHECDAKGNCLKNGIHCSYAHGANDLRQPILDSREIQSTDFALERLTRLCVSLENERALNDDPKWSDSHYVLANYKTEPCKRPPRLCRQGYACPQYHNPRDRRRNPSIFKYKSTPCPHVKQSDEWIDPNVCDAADACKYCHTRTEQQFHPEIYKSTKCNDVSVTGYCPRGPFCAFAHIEQELKSYRDFDLHYTGDLPLTSFIPIPEDKEVENIEKIPSNRSIPKKPSHPSLFEVGSFPGALMRAFEQNVPDRQPLMAPHSGSSNFNVHDVMSQLSPASSQQRMFHQYHMANSPGHPTPPPMSSGTASFLNEQIFLSAAAVAASHSYPPPSSPFTSLAASNLLSSINAHIHSISPDQPISNCSIVPNVDYFSNPLKESMKNSERSPSPIDVKNLIGSSLTAIGLDQVQDDEFDRAASSEPNNDFSSIDNELDNFERSATPATNNQSPTHASMISSTTSNTTITRPVNIPQAFTQQHFQNPSSSRSPFDNPGKLFGNSLDSPINTPFPEPSTSSGNSHRPGELYKMAGFSQDLLAPSHPLQSSSPKSMLQRLSITSHPSSSSSPSSSNQEIDIMRNHFLQMRTIAITEKESSEHWRREAEDNRRLAAQLEQDKNQALQQRDQALHQIEQMRQMLLHNIRLLPNDHDLMQLSMDDVHKLQSKLKQDLSKLTLIEQARFHSSPQHIPSSGMMNSTPPTAGTSSSVTSVIGSPHKRQQKNQASKHVLVPSSSPLSSRKH